MRVVAFQAVVQKCGTVIPTGGAEISHIVSCRRVQRIVPIVQSDVQTGEPVQRKCKLIESLFVEK